MSLGRIQLTKQELEILYVACYHYKRYLDSNPEVGIGPSYTTIVDDLCKYLTFEVSQKDKDKIIALLKG